MSPTDDRSEKERKPYAFNLTLAAVAGQVGCLTLVIIFLALIGGLWLDNQLDTKPMFTVGLMIASVPVTLMMMFWVVRQATSRIQNSSKKSIDSTEEEANRGRES